MRLVCEVKEAVSKNSGEPYQYLEISIGTYKKKVFLETAEKELLKLLVQANPQK